MTFIKELKLINIIYSKSGSAHQLNPRADDWRALISLYLVFAFIIWTFRLYYCKAYPSNHVHMRYWIWVTFYNLCSQISITFRFSKTAIKLHRNEYRICWMNLVIDQIKHSSTSGYCLMLQRKISHNTPFMAIKGFILRTEKLENKRLTAEISSLTPSFLHIGAAT